MRLYIAVALVALSASACSRSDKAANAQNQAAPAGNGQNVASAPAGNRASAGAAITPQEVRAMIERDGASATVRALSQGGTEAAPNRFAAVENGIAGGEQAWLDLVPLLRPGTDGETGEGLTMSLSDALSKNAAGVLRLISSGEDAPSVCGESATETARSDRDAAISAVEGVSDPALAQAKAACLAALRATARAQ